MQYKLDDECEGVVEGGALEGAEMEVEEGAIEGMEDAPQSGNGEEGEGSSLDGEGREVERRLLEGVGPHGEEGEGPMDEGEWGDVGRQLDVEMGMDGLEGVAGAPGLTADFTGKQPVEVFEELFTPEISTNILAQTNQYAQQYVEGHMSHLDAHPRARTRLPPLAICPR